MSSSKHEKDKPKGYGFTLVIALIVALVYFISGGEVDLSHLFYEYRTTGGYVQTIYEDAPYASAFGEDALVVQFLKVGKADSILITLGEESLLLDAGEKDTSDYVSEYIRSQGIDRLDAVIATHPHSDHIGAMADVIDEFRPETCYISPKEHNTSVYERLLDSLEENDVDTIIPKLYKDYSFGEAEITFIAPMEEYDEMNDMSLVFVLKYDGKRLLFMGDAETPSEGDMLRSGYELSCDLIKIGHHGSKTSSGEKFIKAVDADFAVITCEDIKEVPADTKNKLSETEIFDTSKGEIIAVIQNGSLKVFSD